MSPVAPLPAAKLRRTLDPEQFEFQTTRELDGASETVGQERAVESLRFGVGIRHRGYNLFVYGPTGTGRHEIVERHLRERAAKEPVPEDLCYVHEFQRPDRPRAMRLPAGTGVRWRKDMDAFVEEVQSAIPAAFEREEYRVQREALAAEFKEVRDQEFGELAKEAVEKGCVLLQTPTGMALAPAKDGEVLEPEEFQKLPKEEQQRIQEDLKVLTEELRTLIRRQPQREREHRRKLAALDAETARLALGHLVDELRARYSAHPPVLEHLGKVADDVLHHAERFRGHEQPSLQEALGLMQSSEGLDSGFLQRYRVNVLVDHSGSKGAPVVQEDRPSHDDLLGRVDHVAQLGALVTNFTLIKPGALHRAHGGYLVLDALQVLQHPLAWPGLKRALRSQELRIESVGRELGLVSTVSLEPEPVPLDVKVVLVGDRTLFYLLRSADPEFEDLFKVEVELDDLTDRAPDSIASFARLIAGVVHSKGWRDLDRAALARVLEHGSRLAGDSTKLSTRVARLLDLLREADYWAGEAGRELVTADDVEDAIRFQIRRRDRLRESVQEAIERGILRVDVQGERAGCINALKVIDLGGFAFGAPGRVSARVGMGEGDVIDIEREVELGGPTHSKGVMILTGFLIGRFGLNRPLPLSARLVFEQSYGFVEGDSASLAELCALLSAIADVPIRQTFAVTGSVDQHGRAQAIGGVNEKVEGFYDVCSARGLSGEQGVILPATNADHLMLRADVVEAAHAGRFHVYTVESVDEAIELLTGLPAGERQADGRYPEGSFNRRLEDRLDELVERSLEYAREAREAPEGSPGHPQREARP